MDKDGNDLDVEPMRELFRGSQVVRLHHPGMDCCEGSKTGTEWSASFVIVAWKPVNAILSEADRAEQRAGPRFQLLLCNRLARAELVRETMWPCWCKAVCDASMWFPTSGTPLGNLEQCRLRGTGLRVGVVRNTHPVGSFLD